MKSTATILTDALVPRLVEGSLVCPVHCVQWEGYGLARGHRAFCHPHCGVYTNHHTAFSHMLPDVCKSVFTNELKCSKDQNYEYSKVARYILEIAARFLFCCVYKTAKDAQTAIYTNNKVHPKREVL